MSDAQVVGFDQLSRADLVVDCVYRGGSAGNAGADPLAVLVPVGVRGGFRAAGSIAKNEVKLAVLYTSGSEPDWPDTLDPHTGQFTYYGDNRRPGRALEETPRHGNQLLSRVYELVHGDAISRQKVPPFLLFEKAGRGRDVRFRGLLVPGSSRLGSEEDLVAVWRTSGGQRFQNYQAHFTVLDVASISRTWIDQLLAGDPLGSAYPSQWRTWVKSRTYSPLLAAPTIKIRTRQEQQPDLADKPLLELVYQHFKDRPHDFEHFAANLWRMSDAHIDKIDVTRPWRDGGRDAVGDFLLGPPADPVAVEFALEAKCYAENHGVGVRETSRLISRLRYRQFGVLITTSHLDRQAYREIREDGHPIVVIAGRDLVDMLKDRGFDTRSAVMRHLHEGYPLYAAGD